MGKTQTPKPGFKEIQNAKIDHFKQERALEKGSPSLKHSHALAKFEKKLRPFIFPPNKLMNGYSSNI